MNKDKKNTERRPTISLTRTKKSNDNLPNRESRIATTVFTATRSSGPYIIISPVTKNRYINLYFHMLIFPNFFKIKEIRKVYPTKGIRAVQTMFSSQRYVVSRVSPAACHTDKQLKQQKKGGAATMNSRRRGKANNAVIHLYTSGEREKDFTHDSRLQFCRWRRVVVCWWRCHSDVNKVPNGGTANDEGFIFSNAHHGFWIW